MPRTVPLPALQAMLAQQTSEVMVEKLAVSHEMMDEPFRICNDAKALPSNGEVYEPWPFQAVLPTDDPEQEPRAAIQISNVDLSLTIALDQLPSRPKVELGVVAQSDPDSHVYGPLVFDVADERADAQAVTLDLVLYDLDQEPFPRWSFDPVRFMGLF